MFKWNWKLFKPKKIELIVITDNKDFRQSNLRTVVANQQQAEEFVYRSIIKNHFDHYKAWCFYQKRDMAQYDTMLDYIRIVIDKSELGGYYAHKCKYSLDAIAAAFRIASGVEPLGCSYDTPEEQLQLINSLSDEELDEVMTSLKPSETESNIN